MKRLTLVVLLLASTASAKFGVTTVGPETNGELAPGPQCVPTYRQVLCLRKSRPPEELAGVIDCMDPKERELCFDATTFALADKLEDSQLLDRYPGSHYGACVGFEMPEMPRDAPRLCGP